jgi:hypothetical protein
MLLYIGGMHSKHSAVPFRLSGSASIYVCLQLLVYFVADNHSGSKLLRHSMMLLYQGMIH